MVSPVRRSVSAIVERNASFRLERALNGCFRSSLVVDSQQSRWVMKSSGCSKSPYGLINEMLGWEYCHRLRLPLSPYKLTSRPRFYPGDDDELGNSGASGEGCSKRGLHFLSRYLPDLVSSRCYPLLPNVWLSRVTNKHACLGMFVLDVWADHRDKRQAIFSETAAGLKATFIDNTHLFGGPSRNDAARPSRLSAAEIIALNAIHEPGQLQGWIDAMRRVLPDALAQTLELLPMQWREMQRKDRGFQQRFETRLEDLEELVALAVEQAGTFAPAFRFRHFCDLPDSSRASCLPLV